MIRRACLLTFVLLLGMAAFPARCPATPPAEMTFEHGGGLLRWQVPAEWHLAEYPLRREVRLAVAPDSIEVGRKVRLPSSHLWFAVHAEVVLPESQLPERLRQRAAEPRVELHEPLQPVRVGGFAGYSVYGTKTTPEASPLHLSHLLVTTPWGIVELHVESPDADFVGHWTDRFVRHAVLKPPRPIEQPTRQTVVDATPILGTWKAYRSRWRFEPNGEIVLAFDNVTKPSSLRPTPVLKGTYRAHGDLIEIEWRDGSRLNLRWRKEGPWLLTTDHEGRVAQLRRIYE